MTRSRLSPTDINYRANIDVLKCAGVTDLVSLSACGLFKEDLTPRTFVLIHQWRDVIGAALILFAFWSPAYERSRHLA
jgi:purine nucleoside phosphorylase